MRLTRRAAVNLWTAGFAGSAVIQGLFPLRFAQGTPWGYNAGWQREIAIWNIGTVTAVAALRRDDSDVDSALIAGFAVLSALFGTNHLWAARQSPHSWSNWVGAIANGIGLAAGIAAVTTNRGARNTAAAVGRAVVPYRGAP